MSARRAAEMRVGTSGWSYPSGKGTWNGIFYPGQPARRPRGTPKFDELSFYAEHFDTVEVNSSFYRVPSIAAVEKWAERTPAGFEFYADERAVDIVGPDDVVAQSDGGIDRSLRALAAINRKVECFAAA